MNSSISDGFVIDTNSRGHEHDRNRQNAMSGHPNTTTSNNHSSNEIGFVITSVGRSGDRDEAAAERGEGDADTSDSARDEKVMSIYWRGGKFGAAYYDIQNSELYILDEIVDRPPEHQMLCNLFLQVRPAVLVTDSRLPSTFIAVVRRITNHTTPETDRALCKLQFVPGKEYNLEACKRRILQLALLHEPRDCDDEARGVFLRSALNLAHAQSAHALGALLKYLDASWSSVCGAATAKPVYVALKTISLEDIVTIDEETYRGLQIFSSVSHPSNFKKGIQGSSKEGLSLFHLFNKCYSKVGASLMKILLQHPTRDIGELESRQDVIAFCNNPQNDTVVRNICSSLKLIKNVSNIMSKIKSLSAKPSEWKSLYNVSVSTHVRCPTLYHTVLICEICEKCSGSRLIEGLGASDNNSLYEVALYMNRIIDFDLSKSQGKFTVKHGVDPELDKKKQVMASLHGLMSATAKCELEKLPSYIEECTMVYIPHLGYLLGVKAWAQQLTMEQKQLPDLKFMFQNHDYIHYKSKGCEELDMMIGDTYPEIMAHETRIMMRLTAVVMDNLQTLSHLIDKCAQLDCLIAFSKVCKELNFVRPKMTNEKVINIKQGKHPLHMICTENFVPNDTICSIQEGFVKILTGPNSCGKSVYLKQVALIVYLAHIGCFVPAQSAEIGVVTHIYTRIRSAECVGSHMSAFLIDLRQMSLSIGESTSNSLVIIDEFGKGTSEADGLALLSACVNTFLFQEQDCPHMFVSTHFFNINKYISKSPLIKFQSFEYMVQNDELVFLFRLVDGYVKSSFAHKVLEITGMDKRIVSRAKDVMECMKNGTLPKANTVIISRLKNITKTTIQQLLSRDD